MDGRGQARGSFRSSARPATSATVETRPSRTALATTPSTCRNSASSGNCRSPRSRIYKSLDNGATWTPGRRAAIAATNFDATTGNRRHALLQRQALHDDRQQPEQPLVRTAVRDVTRASTSLTTAPATPARSSSLYTDSVPSQDPPWRFGRRRTSWPTVRGGRPGILGQPVLGPGRREEREAGRRVHPRGVQHVARPRPAVQDLDQRRLELLLKRQREQARTVGRQPGRVGPDPATRRSARRTPSDWPTARRPGRWRSCTRTTSAVRGTGISM